LKCRDDSGRRAAENHLTTGPTYHSTSGISADDVIIVVVSFRIAAPREFRALVYVLDRLRRRRVRSPATGRGHVTRDVTSAPAAGRRHDTGSRVSGADERSGRVDRGVGGVLVAAQETGRWRRRWGRQRLGVVVGSPR